jgi:hypothetical protein
VDYDGDGNLDLISGSYDPGEVYLFRGLGKGKFAAREVMKDKSGKPILKTPDQKEPVESFGSWVTLVDWDEDGDLDMLVGTFEGMIFMRRNEGTRRKPEYATENEWLTVGKKRLRVPGGAHANPVIVDFDGDGRWDLVTGSGDGGVYWYRNDGTPGKPSFVAPVALVPKHEGPGYSEPLKHGEAPRPGIRSQIAVTDYDGDGKLDVLVGDFCTNMHFKRGLSAEDLKEIDKLLALQKDLHKAASGAMEDMRKRYVATLKGVPRSEWNNKENSARWQKMYREFRDSESTKKAEKEGEAISKKLNAFVEAGGRGAGALRDGDPDVPHGYVWLFRQK